MSRPDSERCARILLQVVPQVMQAIRAEVRRGRGPELSVLQLRALAFLHRHPGEPLSALAEHVGLTLPSMSSQVSGLVSRGLIDRAVSPTDRRFVTLRLTEQGEAVFQEALHQAEASMTQALDGMSEEDLATVTAALQILGSVFVRSDMAPQSSLAPEVGASTPD